MSIEWVTVTDPKAHYAKMLRGYPGLFWEPICCMTHMFSVIGNGYDWTDCGNLIYMECGEEYTLTRDLMSIKERDIRFVFDDYIEDFVVKNAEKLAESRGFLLPKNSSTVYSLMRHNAYWSTDYVKFFTAPENVTDAWLAELIEFGRVWLMFIPEVAEQKRKDVKGKLASYLKEQERRNE